MLISPGEAMLRLTLQTASAPADVAGVLARIARPRDVIGLGGKLGTGKTAFARAFINARAEQAGHGPMEVPSPTYTLVQSYDIGGTEIFHFDLYRLDSAHDALELGIEDALADGMVLIEWPERLGPLVPGRTLHMTFTQGANAGARQLEMDVPEDWRERIGGRLEHWRA